MPNGGATISLCSDQYTTTTSRTDQRTNERTREYTHSKKKREVRERGRNVTSSILRYCRPVLCCVFVCRRRFGGELSSVAFGGIGCTVAHTQTAVNILSATRRRRRRLAGAKREKEKVCCCCCYCCCCRVIPTFFFFFGRHQKCFLPFILLCVYLLCIGLLSSA